MKINIQYIPQDQHRYNTLGDWYYTTQESDPDGEEVLEIRATDFPTRPGYSLLIAYHELTEALICQELGITQEEVDKWDFRYNELLNNEGELMDCDCPLTAEPGDDPHAPYHDAHVTACLMERLMAHVMQVNWSAYEAFIEGDTGE